MEMAFFGINSGRFYADRKTNPAWPAQRIGLKMVNHDEIHSFIRAIKKVAIRKLLPLPAWHVKTQFWLIAVDETKHLQHMRNPQYRRYDESQQNCLNFAILNLPLNVLSRFKGAAGRYALEVIACGGTLDAFPDLERLIGISEWRVRRILEAQPGFRVLVDLCEQAYHEWGAAQYEAEEAWRQDMIAIEDTYRQIDSEMWSDVTKECLELGLID